MNLSSATDLELQSFLKQDSREAFEEIYRRYWRDMYQSGLSIVKDSDLARDLVQEIFIRFWEHRYHINITSLRSYLMNAIKYKVANSIRHEKVKESFFTEAQKINLDYYYPDDQLELSQLKQFIQQATDALPTKCKEIFFLSRNEHLSNREIALQLGISEKTVENQMTIALKKLKKSLGNFYFYIFLA